MNKAELTEQLADTIFFANGLSIELRELQDRVDDIRDQWAELTPETRGRIDELAPGLIEAIRRTRT